VRGHQYALPRQETKTAALHGKQHSAERYCVGDGFNLLIDRRPDVVRVGRRRRCLGLALPPRECGLQHPERVPREEALAMVGAELVEVLAELGEIIDVVEAAEGGLDEAVEV